MEIKTWEFLLFLRRRAKWLKERFVSNVLEVKTKTGKQKLEANVHQKIKEARDGRKLVLVLAELNSWHWADGQNPCAGLCCWLGLIETRTVIYPSPLTLVSVDQCKLKSNIFLISAVGIFTVLFFFFFLIPNEHQFKDNLYTLGHQWARRDGSAELSVGAPELPESSPSLVNES